MVRYHGVARGARRSVAVQTGRRGRMKHGNPGTRDHCAVLTWTGEGNAPDSLRASVASPAGRGLRGVMSIPSGRGNSAKSNVSWNVAPPILSVALVEEDVAMVLVVCMKASRVIGDSPPGMTAVPRWVGSVVG